VLREQQDPARARAAYRFARRTTNALDNLPLQGAGWPSRHTGLVRSAFRPSDDACMLPFHVPANFMAATSLGQLETLARVTGRTQLADDAAALAAELNEALAALPVPWPYEVDGHGNALFMDDANLPSLLSLPYLGACASDDPRYLAARAYMLGPHNPWFVSGRALQGVGSPHTPLGSAWPMAIIARALTSLDDAEITLCLQQLRASHAGTGFMHESVDADDPTRYTRPWFGWANSLFGELILTLADQRPHLLRQL
jgi:meiotically up-regulated gene 157 (Mug157) protein